MDFAPDNNTRLNVPQKAAAADGRPWLTWTKNADPVNLFRFDGTSFVAVPIVPVPASRFGGVSLTFLNGDAVIAWEPAAFYGPVRDFTRSRSIADSTSVPSGHARFGGNRGIIAVLRIAFP